MKENHAKTFVSVLAVTGAVLLSGCATSPFATPEEKVAQRSQQRLALMGARDFTKAYEYLAPSYRALNSVDAYRGQFGNSADWIDPKVASVNCPEKDRCIVNVKLGVRIVARGFGTKPIPADLQETWLLEDGQWWYHQAR